MPIFGQQKKPKTVEEGLGLETTGGVVSAPASPMASLAAGGAMGSLTDQVMERKKMNGELGSASQEDPSAFFNNKKKKRNNNGITNESSGFGQSQA